MSDLQHSVADLAGIDSMTVAELAVLPAATFVSLRAEVNRIAEEAYRFEAKLNSALDYRYGPRARQARAAQHKDTGTVRFEDNGFIVVAELPKRVKWDQQRLKEIADLIATSWGEDPANYLKLKFDVSERAYEAWPPMLQDVFTPARTVETGRPSYELMSPDGRRA